MNYIQRREKKISQLRQRIFTRWAVSLVFVLFAGVFSMQLWVLDPPEEWRTATLQYHDIKREWMGRRHRSDVITGLDGSMYVIQRSRERTIDEIKSLLKKGDSYSIIYTITPLGGKNLCGLYSGDQAILSFEYYEALWQDRCDECRVTMWVFLAMGVLSWILIDRIWCRKLYQKIRIHKEEIRLKIERGKKRKDRL